MGMSKISSEDVSAALREVADNADQYSTLFDVLRDPEKRKNIDAVLAAGFGAAVELQKDAASVVPVVREIGSVVRDGTQTSEFKMASVVGRVLTIVAILAPVIEAFLSVLENAPAFAGNSLWVTGGSIVLKTLLAIAYGNGRSKVKVAAATMLGEVVKR